MADINDYPFSPQNAEQTPSIPPELIDVVDEGDPVAEATHTDQFVEALYSATVRKPAFSNLVGDREVQDILNRQNQTGEYVEPDPAMRRGSIDKLARVRWIRERSGIDDMPRAA